MVLKSKTKIISDTKCWYNDILKLIQSQCFLSLYARTAGCTIIRTSELIPSDSASLPGLSSLLGTEHFRPYSSNSFASSTARTAINY